jgi:hypothetical protein
MSQINPATPSQTIVKFISTSYSFHLLGPIVNIPQRFYQALTSSGFHDLLLQPCSCKHPSHNLQLAVNALTKCHVSWNWMLLSQTRPQVSQLFAAPWTQIVGWCSELISKPRISSAASDEWRKQRIFQEVTGYKESNSQLAQSLTACQQILDAPKREAQTKRWRSRRK